ncbi:MAG: DUF192 domain-containing protein [Sphingorhabdus sp.]
MAGLCAAICALSLAACTLPANGEGAAAASGNCAAGEAGGTSEAGLEQIALCIESDGEMHLFTAEVAKTIQQQARGLMFRTQLADDAGMLFPYDKPQTLSFWMKNTVIPLDIIFIRDDGSIESIAANTVPYSLEPVAAGAPVTAVLELRGGRTVELGIKAGDRVVWKK